MTSDLGKCLRIKSPARGADIDLHVGGGLMVQLTRETNGEWRFYGLAYGRMIYQPMGIDGSVLPAGDFVDELEDAYQSAVAREVAT